MAKAVIVLSILLTCLCLQVGAVERVFDEGIELQESQELVIEGATVRINGGLELADSSRLVFRNCEIQFESVEPDIWGGDIVFHVRDEAELIIERSRLTCTYGSGETPRYLIVSYGNATVELRQVDHERIVLLARDESQSRITDSLIGELRLQGVSHATVTTSEIDGEVVLDFSGDCSAELNGLQPGDVDSWSFPQEEGSARTTPSIAIEQSAVRNWGIGIHDQAHLTVRNSTLAKAFIEFDDPSGTIRSLGAGEYSEWRLASSDELDIPLDLRLVDTEVESGFYLAIEYGTGDLELVECELKEFNIEQFFGTLRLVGTDIRGLQCWDSSFQLIASSSRIHYGMDLVGSSLTVKGSTVFTSPIYIGEWTGSTFDRVVAIQLVGSDWQPVVGATIRVEDADATGSTPMVLVTDEAGEADFTIHATERNWSTSWNVTIQAPDGTTQLRRMDLFSPSPFLIRLVGG